MSEALQAGWGILYVAGGLLGLGLAVAVIWVVGWVVFQILDDVINGPRKRRELAEAAAKDREARLARERERAAAMARATARVYGRP